MNDENLRLIQSLQPGEIETTRILQFTVDVSSIRYAGQLTSNYGIFTLLLPLFSNAALDSHHDEDQDEEDVDDHQNNHNPAAAAMDFVLKTSDGWTGSNITTILNLLSSHRQAAKEEASKATTIYIEGYPERMRSRHVHETTPWFVHLQRIRIITTTTDQRQRGQPHEGDDDQVLRAKNAEKEFRAVSVPPKAHIIKDEKRNGNNSEKGSKTAIDKFSSNTNRGANDTSRFAKVVAFLVEEFGYDSSLPILDVAGGASAGLAFELVVRHAVPCITVDTKPLALSPRQIKHCKYRDTCAKSLVASCDNEAALKESPLALHLYHRFSPKPQLQQLLTLLDSNHVLCKRHEIHLEKKGTEEGIEDDKSQLRSLLLSRQCSVIVGLVSCFDHKCIGLESTPPSL